MMERLDQPQFTLEPTPDLLITIVPKDLNGDSSTVVLEVERPVDVGESTLPNRPLQTETTTQHSWLLAFGTARRAPESRFVPPPDVVHVPHRAGRHLGDGGWEVGAR